MDRYVNRLSDYIDDEDLDPRERAEIEAHLAACSSCRDLLAELRGVAARASLLAGVPPDRDLWPGIAERIGATAVLPFRAAARRISFTIPQLVAASLALMVLSGAMVWMVKEGAPGTDVPPVVANTPPDPDPAAIQPANFADTYYEEAIADLEKALAAGRDRLDPQTVRVLEENLLAIDRAIEQSRKALAADPANTFLNMHLASARQRKLALLRDATALTLEGRS
jgi:tetratricopeptide (TPR) repeat protein